MVGEHSQGVEGRPVRATGALGRENVGMSNHYPDEKSGPRKSKVSVAMAINHGLGGPKAMAKAAADGQPVNIPARRYFRPVLNKYHQFGGANFKTDSRRDERSV